MPLRAALLLLPLLSPAWSGLGGSLFAQELARTELVAGQRASFRVTGLSPGALVAFLYSSNGGHPVEFWGLVRSSSCGAATLSIALPHSAPETPILVQAFALARDGSWEPSWTGSTAGVIHSSVGTHENPSDGFEGDTLSRDC